MAAFEKQMDEHLIRLIVLASIAGYSDFADGLIELSARTFTRPYFEQLFAGVDLTAFGKG